MAGDRRDNGPRERFPSIEEITDAVRRGVEQAHPVTESDAPTRRWIERRIGIGVIKAGKVVLLGALTALGAGVAGYAWRGCQIRAADHAGAIPGAGTAAP